MTNQVDPKLPINPSIVKPSSGNLSKKNSLEGLPFYSNSGTEEDQMVVRIPRTEISRNAICLRGKAQKNAQILCSASGKTKRRAIYKKENRGVSKKITVQVVKRTFPLNTVKVVTCTAIGMGIGAIGFATPAAPIAGPVGTAVGGGVGFAIGTCWASRTVKKKVNVTIDKSDDFAFWRVCKIEEKVYPVFRNFLNTDERFKKFICPITGELILMPMKDPFGHVWDWEYIESYIDDLTDDPSELVPSPHDMGQKFCKNDLVFDRKFCLDLIKKAERTYNKVIDIQNEHIKAEGLKAVIKNTKHVMEFIREQVEASVYQDLQPKVDSGEITDAERDEMVEKACTQWDFRKK